jgi:hypothetical protein
MDTVNAKLFEWHRVDQDLTAARVHLKEAVSQAQPEAALGELYSYVALLEERWRELLLDVQRLRALRDSE